MNMTPEVIHAIEAAVESRLAAMHGGNNPLSLMQEGDYGNVHHAVRVFEAYRQFQRWEQMQESGTTSDFPTYLSNAVNKQFFTAYEEVQSAWREYSGIRNVPDFKQLTLVGLSELDDLLEILEDGQYEDSQINEMPGPKVQIGTFGRLFSLSRKAMINDDIGRFNEITTKMGDAAARTLATAVVNVLITNPNAYDGIPLFHASHGNLGSQAFSETSLPIGMTAMRTQTNQNGRRMNVTPEILLHPVELEFTIKRVLNSAVIPQPGTGLGQANVVQNAVRPLLEPFLMDSSDWYLLANPRQYAAVIVAFLNGAQEPALMQHRTVQLLSGGFDPYRLEVDKLTWKIRHDWGTTVGEWRGAYKSVVP